MTDNVAVLDGFTKAILAESIHHTLYLLVKPDADLGERFKAWDMDEQEFIWVNGWLFTCEETFEPA
jgi:hypothetical protein